MKCVGFLLFFWPFFSHAQLVQWPDRSVQTDPIMLPPNWVAPFSANVNPALLSSPQPLMFSLFSEMPFGMPELTRHQLDIIFPAGRGAMGVGFDHRRSAGIQKNRFSWGMGRHLGRFDLGIQLHFTNTSFQGYKPSRILSTGLAMHWQMKENLAIATVLLNPFKPPQLGEGTERPALEIRTAAHLRFSEHLGLSAGYDYTETIDASFRLDLFYEVQDRLRVTVGYESGRPVIWLKGGWIRGLFQVFTGLEYHPYLGMTPAWGVIITGKKPERL